MVSRFNDLERKTILVQFVAVEPLAFYSTSDGTDLVQDSLRLHLARPDADIFGQEGSLSIEEHGEFLTFEPLDTNNRTLHLPIEHLAYCGALRRMRRDSSDQQNSEQIHRREFENIDLANRFAQYIVGPPIFTAVFHGFDNALCYMFVTQSAEDACLLVMKLMRAFKLYEQKIEQQGQLNQGSSSMPPFSSFGGGSPLPIDIKRDSPLLRSSQGFLTDNRQTLSSPFVHQAPSTTINSFIPDPRQDEIVQRLLANPNLELVNQPAPFTSQRFNDLPIMSASSMNQRPSPNIFNNNASSSSNFPLMSKSSPQLARPPSPPVFGVPDMSDIQRGSLNDTKPQVVYKPNNQEVVYKQNIMVRWLQPPTPPPPAPIIIREVQAPAPPQPPIICRQMAPCPRTPPPIIIREKPPPCPPIGQPLVIEKRIPPVTLPRQVIVERYPAPPAKPPTIIYEKYLPQQPQIRPLIVKREVCGPAGYPIVQQQVPGGQIVREIIRPNPQMQSTCQPALVCTPQQQISAQPTYICVPQQQTATQMPAVQQLMPVFTSQQNMVQPQGIRVIRQVIGPPQLAVQQPQQVYATAGSPTIQAMPTAIMQ